MNNPKSQHIIYFDGICNLCHWSINFVLKRDKKKIFLFAPLQSHFANTQFSRISSREVDFETVIYQQGQQFYTKSRAAIEILIALGGLWSLARILKIIPKPFLDKFYDYIASHRYQWFGKKSECMVPSADIKARFQD